ncbi:hypothetical protein ACQ4PT_059203 [Festuca glaucescens]
MDASFTSTRPSAQASSEQRSTHTSLERMKLTPSPSDISPPVAALRAGLQWRMATPWMMTLLTFLSVKHAQPSPTTTRAPRPSTALYDVTRSSCLAGWSCRGRRRSRGARPGQGHSGACLELALLGRHRRLTSSLLAYCFLADLFGFGDFENSMPTWPTSTTKLRCLPFSCHPPFTNEAKKKIWVSKHRAAISSRGGSTSHHAAISVEKAASPVLGTSAKVEPHQATSSRMRTMNYIDQAQCFLVVVTVTLAVMRHTLGCSADVR